MRVALWFNQLGLSHSDLAEHGDCIELPEAPLLGDCVSVSAFDADEDEYVETTWIVTRRVWVTDSSEKIDLEIELDAADERSAKTVAEHRKIRF
jgi:hypothetical protein